MYIFFFFFSSRRRHTRWTGDWSSDVCSSDLVMTVSTELNSLAGDDPDGAARTSAFQVHLEVFEGPFDLLLALISKHKLDRKSTRLNSSHPSISYAVFCLKKKKKTQ